MGISFSRSSSVRYVIVGGGIAGTTAAEELRKRAPDAEIILVSEELHPVYSRVLLPHYVKGLIPRERVFLKKESWYEEQNIEWLPGLRVDALDARNKFVALSDGRELPYDKILLATGGDAKPLLEEPRGVSYFRTLDDADHLVQLLQTRAPDAHAAVYGSGFIACEYINLFKHLDLPTTVALRGSHFWSRVLDAASGELIQRKLVGQGFEVVTGVLAEKAEGDRDLAALVTDKKRIPCSILGIGVGVEPDLGWLREAGVEVNRGVKTNEYLETNLPDVYAAGDNVEYLDTAVGRQRMAGTWQNAMTQGRVAARNMAGEREAFRLVSSFSMNVAGIDVILVGDADRAAAEQIMVRGSAEAGGVTQLFLRGGKLVGATLVNRNTDRAAVTKMIDTGTDISHIAI